MRTKQIVAQWLEITPNKRINELIDKLPSIYDNQSDEYGKDIHTTHVTAECLRESYFRIVSPKRTTSREAKSFIIGEAQHVILQRLLGPLLKAEPEKRILTEIKNGRYVGIVSRIDMFAEPSELLQDGAIVEIKTNSSFVREIKAYYLKQIRLYMAATGKQNAVLIIIWQNAAREVSEKYKKMVSATRHIEAYDIKLTKAELEADYERYKARYFDLTNALIAQKPAQLFAIKQDVNLRKTACKWCKYKKECDSVDKPSERRFGLEGRANSRRENKRNE